jgi:hydrogenase expression/formation protein HypC
MCLAVPMQVDVIDGFKAVCSTQGVSRDVNLFLLQDQPVAVGDHVLVHLGYAIQVISSAEARRYWDAFDEVLAKSPA